MNGIGLLVLIAAAGQLGATPPSLSNNFGWDFDNRSPDHALCYIIQVSPQQAEEMQRTDQEFPSSMPPDLVGRATRILVRIGTDPLPQNPPLEELRKMPRVYPAADVTAGLGGGRLSDVEPESLINVQQDRSPTLPAFPNQGLASPPPDTSSANSNLADRLQKGAANLADEVKSLARGTPGFPNAAGNAAADATPPLPGFGGTGPASRFGNSALDNTTNPPLSNSGRFADNGTIADNTTASDWRPPVSNLGNDRNRENPSSIADNRLLNPYAAGNTGGNNSGSQQDYDLRVPPSLTTNLQTSVPNVQTPSNGFGTYNGNQGPNKFGVPNSSFDNNSTQSQYSQNQFPQGAPEIGGQGTSFGGAPSGQGNAPYTPPLGYGSQPSANGQFVNSGGGIGVDNGSRIAANGLPPANNAIQGQGTGLNGAGLATGQGGFSQSPNDSNSDTEKALAKPKTFDNILSVILLLSLLVNGYMGALIRKLLTRYRTLLANMRGQSIPNTFGA